MTEPLITACFLAIPLLFSGSLHMLVVSKNWFPAWATPINAKAYGKNKTWRGIIVMVLMTIPGVYLAYYLQPLFHDYVSVSFNNLNLVLLGLALGAAYVVAELPNSYIKRRLHIAPGQPAKQYKLLFSFIDQADSAIGCSIVYALMVSPSLAVIISMILLGPVIHLIANMMLFSFGLRQQPF